VQMTALGTKYPGRRTKYHTQKGNVFPSSEKQISHPRKGPKTAF